MDSCEEMNSIIYMDHVLYEAAGAGNIDPFEDYQTTSLDRLLTPDESTILHVYLRNQRGEPESTDFVDMILERCPPLLLQANKKGETPLHLAAKYGHSNVVKLLIDRAKAQHADSESGVTAAEMMRRTNGEGDTALHEAARNARGRVVEILTKEDPDFSYSANVHGETPLYIAASVGRRPEQDKVIDSILGNCNSVDYGGPNGRTALHAAITARDDETTRKILRKEKKLTKATDENGWTPLHYVAYFSRRYNSSAVKLLLKYDASAAYITETEKKRTALHIAAVQGKVCVMRKIISHCPACCDLVDNRGWNALHYLVACQKFFTFRACLWRIPELERLKTEKDDKGNTPFHLIAALTHKQGEWNFVYRDRESGIYGLNKQELSISNIYRGDFGEIQKEIVESLEDVGSGPFGYGPFLLGRVKAKNREEVLNKERESQLLATVLIATVTFAAAFTLPGGYKTDQGTAILAKKAAFIVFVISDAISLVLSISAVFIHFVLVFSQNMYNQTTQSTGMLFVYARLFTMSSMGTMIIAFITGTYAVLEPVLGLAISICLIGLSFFFLGWLEWRNIMDDFD